MKASLLSSVLLLLALAAPCFAEDPPAFLLQWGSYGTADGQFRTPLGLGIDAAGNIYVADSQNDRIQVFDGNGHFIAKFGTTGTDSAQFRTPLDVAVAPDGSIYVADYGNSRVDVFNSQYHFLRQWSHPPEAASCHSPSTRPATSST